MEVAESSPASHIGDSILIPGPAGIRSRLDTLVQVQAQRSRNGDHDEMDTAMGVPEASSNQAISCSGINVPVTLVSIEMPCFTTSVERAVELLGGESKVLACLKDIDQPNNRQPKYLKCKLSNHTFYRPLESAAAGSGSILIRMKRVIRRKKIIDNNDTSGNNSNNNSSDNSGEQVIIKESVELLGFVHKKFEFNDPFDVQFGPLSPDLPSVESLLAPLPSGGQQPLLEIFPPNNFFPRKKNAGDASRFKSTAFYDDIIGIGGDAASKHINKKDAVKINTSKTPIEKSVLLFNDPLPPIPTAADWAAEKRQPSVLAAIKLMEDLLDENPIWSKSILSRHTDITLYQVEAYAGIVSFSYKNGPFTYYFIKHGYSVALNPQARIYQRISVRHVSADTIRETLGKHIKIGSHSWLQNVTIDLDDLCLKPFEQETKFQKKRSPLTLIVLGNFMKETRMFPMVCDYPDLAFTERFGSLPRLDTIDSSTGWLRPADYDKIRRLFQGYVTERQQRFLAIDGDFLVSTYFNTYIKPLAELSVTERQERESQWNKAIWETTIAWRKSYKDALQSTVPVVAISEATKKLRVNPPKQAIGRPPVTKSTSSSSSSAAAVSGGEEQEEVEEEEEEEEEEWGHEYDTKEDEDDDDYEYVNKGRGRDSMNAKLAWIDSTRSELTQAVKIPSNLKQGTDIISPQSLGNNKQKRHVSFQKDAAVSSSANTTREQQAIKLPALLSIASFDNRNPFMIESYEDLEAFDAFDVFEADTVTTNDQADEQEGDY